jgi:Protein of unknown function (DUF3309)
VHPILLIILILLIVGFIPTWPYASSYTYGWYPSVGLLVLLLVLLLVFRGVL